MNQEGTCGTKMTGRIALRACCWTCAGCASRARIGSVLHQGLCLAARNVLHQGLCLAARNEQLVASDEMTPLEPADRHPAPSQKLSTSRQPAPHTAPALAPPLSSVLIALSSLSLNLPYMNPPSQTGDSNLVADKTIDNIHRKKESQQKARRHVLASPPLVASDDAVGAGRSTPCAFAEVTNVETADPACSAHFGTPSFVCFDCSQPSIFESASHQPTLANRRFTFSRLHDN